MLGALSVECIHMSVLCVYVECVVCVACWVCLSVELSVLSVECVE